MADKMEKMKTAIEKLKGKKGKLKVLKDKPTGTKPKKLPKGLAKLLEDHFNTNLSKVRVHSGGNAAEIAKSMGSKAFTVGFDLYFSKPADANNMHLIAHELTHVIQQGAGKVKPAKKGKAIVSK